jgi:hypothetical protein
MLSRGTAIFLPAIHKTISQATWTEIIYSSDLLPLTLIELEGLRDIENGYNYFWKFDNPRTTCIYPGLPALLIRDSSNTQILS